MVEENATNRSKPAGQIRFSLRTLFIVVTIVCLVLALLLCFQQLTRTQQQLRRANDELLAMRPLSPEEVKVQLEEQTNYNSVTGKVEDVRYSQAQNEYLVKFAYTIKKSGQTSTTEVRLKGDGFGQWAGTIQSADFASAVGLGGSGVCSVLVKTRSPLEKK